MLSGISTALSGIDAAMTRLDVSAGNIANQASTQSTDPNGVTSPYVPQQVVQSSLAGGGVATSTRPLGPAGVSQSDPAQQVINANLAGYDARANLKSIQVQSDMLQRALDIIR